MGLTTMGQIDLEDRECIARQKVDNMVIESLLRTAFEISLYEYAAAVTMSDETGKELFRLSSKELNEGLDLVDVMHEEDAKVSATQIIAEIYNEHRDDFRSVGFNFG